MGDKCCMVMIQQAEHVQFVYFFCAERVFHVRRRLSPQTSAPQMLHPRYRQSGTGSVKVTGVGIVFQSASSAFFVEGGECFSGHFC